MHPVLYVWNFTPERLSTLREICKALSVALRPVSPQEAALPLGRLPDAPPAAGLMRMPFDGEMLLMARFPDPLTDAFLARLRQAGLSVPRKAVLTPFNALWDSARLYAELSREAAAFAARR